ncbi:MAG: inner membrane protein YiaA [Bacteroidota bacterium]
MKNIEMQKPSNAFIGASWIVLIIGMASYIIGLWNAEMQFNEKGYYFTVLIFGLFAVISLQKTVRDQLEGIPVTNVYYGLAWGMSLLSVLLIVVGLWNAELELSEKGFFGISFILSLFSSIAVQKNLRDVKSSDHDHTNKPYQES